MRQYLVEIAEDNPIDLDIAEAFGDFPNRKATAAWLARQESCGNLRCVGTRRDAQGRKVIKVYCNGWKPKDDNLRHEIIGTFVRLIFSMFQFVRGYKVNDCFCDMLMITDERHYEIEIDGGSLRQKQVQWRWRRHKCDHSILVITDPNVGDPEDRLARLLKWSGELGDRVFLTTLDRLRQHGPHARVWEFIGRGEKPLKRVKPPVSSAFEDDAQDTPQMVSTIAVEDGQHAGS